MSRTGVLLTAFGGPASLEEIPQFMASLMRREPSETMIDSARRRYTAIGGGSPLPAIAERIAAALERAINGLSPAADQGEPGRSGADVAVPVAVGMRYSRPGIGQAVAALAEQGVTKVVWLSLSPFESEVSTGAYGVVVRESCAAVGAELAEADAYHLSDGFLALLSDACAAALAELPEGTRRLVVMTAHSLPASDTGSGVYVEQLSATAEAVAGRSGLGAVDPEGLGMILGLRALGGPGGASSWLLAYQSKGRGGTWLEPELDAVIDAAASVPFDGVAVVPIGFVTDHLETLYDLDIAAADRVLGHDMAFARARVPNDDPAMIQVLSDAVRGRL